MPRRKPSTQRDTPNLNTVLAILGEPFAKAMATFAREAAGSLAERKAGQEVVRQLEESGSVRRLMQAHHERVIAENAKLEAEGRLEEVEFTPDRASHTTRNGARRKTVRSLRAIARAKGITQKELAARTGMDPAMVSRVLKDPDRSRLATVKKLARALEVSLAELD